MPTSYSDSEFQSDGSIHNESDSDLDTYESDLAEDDEDYAKEVEVLVSGLELLFSDQTSLASFKTDGADCGDGSSSSMTSLEVDSLVLTRERLPHLRHQPRKQEVRVEANQDFDIIMEDYEVPLNMPLSGVTKRKSESGEDTDTTYSDDEWDSLTVDSLILTRRRLAAGKNKSRPRRIDSLILTRRRKDFGNGKNNNEADEIGDAHEHNKGHHVHYNARLNKVISISKPNTGGFNCAA